MIGATSKILLGVIVGAALLVALTVAMCTDLFAPETRPELRRLRERVRQKQGMVGKRPAIRSLRGIPSRLVSRHRSPMEVRT